jgi:hypothetical protein
MALIDFGENWEARGTQYRADFRRGFVPGEVVQEKQHVRTFYAETDDPQMDGEGVIAAALAWAGPGPPLPPAWDPHPNDPNALLVTYEARQRDVPEVWQLSANYSTYLDPIQEAAEIAWAGAANQWVVEDALSYFDLVTGDEITGPVSVTNSAGDRFSPPPAELEPYAILTVTKNFAIPTAAIPIPTPPAGYDPLLVQSNYVNRLNRTPFAVPGVPASFPVDTVLLSGQPAAKWMFQKAVQYYQTSWVFWVRKRPWYLRAADMGWNQWADKAIGSSYVRIVINGQFSANQQCLDGNGALAARGAPVVYLTYRTKDRADFNELNLFQGM